MPWCVRNSQVCIMATLRACLDTTVPFRFPIQITLFFPFQNGDGYFHSGNGRPTEWSHFCQTGPKLCNLLRICNLAGALNHLGSEMARNCIFFDQGWHSGAESGLSHPGYKFDCFIHTKG